jgi:hypothetical protein
MNVMLKVKSYGEKGIHYQSDLHAQPTGFPDLRSRDPFYSCETACRAGGAAFHDGDHRTRTGEIIMRSGVSRHRAGQAGPIEHHGTMLDQSSETVSGKVEFQTSTFAWRQAWNTRLVCATICRYR